MSTSDIPPSGASGPRPSPFTGNPALRDGPREAGTRDIPPPGRENYRPGSGGGATSKGNATAPGCSRRITAVIAAFLTVALWLPVTYLLLPLTHQATPLAYGVSTALLVLLGVQMYEYGMETQRPPTPPSGPQR